MKLPFISAVLAGGVLIAQAEAATVLASYADGDAASGTTAGSQNVTLYNKAASVEDLTVSSMTGTNFWGGGAGPYRASFGVSYYNTGLGTYGLTSNRQSGYGSNATGEGVFDLTAAAGSTVSLESISFDWFCVNNDYTAGIDTGAHFRILVSVDGGQAVEALDWSSALSNLASGTKTSLGSENLNFNQVFEGRSIRVYFTDVQMAGEIVNAGGVAQVFQNIKFYGDVQAQIPEPASMTLGLLALAGFGMRRRR